MLGWFKRILLFYNNTTTTTTATTKMLQKYQVAKISIRLSTKRQHLE